MFIKLLRKGPGWEDHKINYLNCAYFNWVLTSTPNILVKFYNSYSRSLVLSAKRYISKCLKPNGRPIFIHKDLTKRQSKVYNHCRSLTAKLHGEEYSVKCEYAKVRVGKPGHAVNHDPTGPNVQNLILREPLDYEKF